MSQFKGGNGFGNVPRRGSSEVSESLGSHDGPSGGVVARRSGGAQGSQYRVDERVVGADVRGVVVGLFEEQ